MSLNKNDYPWVKSESNLTKEEWETHRDWVLSFCGDVVDHGELLEEGKYFKVKTSKHEY
jgi:hypothetical protein